MYPIALNLTRVSVLLAGHGDMVLRRLAALDEARAGNVGVYCEQPSLELRKAAGARLVERLPEDIDLQNYTVILLAGLPRPVAEKIVTNARLLGRLVNVEDINDLCDFYFTANIRRGDLTIAVSTGGASPTLARKVRDAIARRFGEEWVDHVQEIAELRKDLRARGADMKEVVETTERHLLEKGWLKKGEVA